MPPVNTDPAIWPVLLIDTASRSVQVPDAPGVPQCRRSPARPATRTAGGSQVDERFSLCRYDAVETIQAFSARTREQIGLDMLSAERRG
jgi:hypothetical protein